MEVLAKLVILVVGFMCPHGSTGPHAQQNCFRAACGDKQGRQRMQRKAILHLFFSMPLFVHVRPRKYWLEVENETVFHARGQAGCWGTNANSPAKTA